MLLGMFTGLGTVLFLFSLIRVLYLRFAPASKLKTEEINRKDERNIQVFTRRGHGGICSRDAVMRGDGLCPLFGWANRVPAYIVVGAIWVQVIVFLIAQKNLRIQNVKMTATKGRPSM